MHLLLTLFSVTIKSETYHDFIAALNGGDLDAVKNVLTRHPKWLNARMACSLRFYRYFLMFFTFFI